ncbi:MAG: hypothetical protein KJP00_15965, partial [Bacteroidia bacterium]|nr:hypothetical protein [Bacteroidia bacterium]
NTRLSIYSERFKIRKMQLVGALPWIITKPFVKSAIGVAAIAALIAILGIGILLFVSYPQVSSFNMLQAWTILGKVSVFLLVISITISIVSSYVIVNRYLKMDLDDLYG